MTNLKFWQLFTLLLATLAITPLTSCGDDEDNGGNGPGNGPAAPSTSNTVFTTLDSKKVSVSSIGYYDFVYDNDYNITKINNLTIAYATGTIVYNDGDGSTAKFEMNGNGHITKLKYTSSDDDDYESYNETADYEFSYSGTQLTEVKYNSTSQEIYKSTGSTSKETESTVLKFNWKDGSIVSVTENYEYSVKENNEPTKYADETTTYTVITKEDNALRQPTISYADWLDNNIDNIYPLALAGMLGKNSAKLPATVVMEMNGNNIDGTTTQESSTAEYVYAIDELSGKIQVEKVNGSTFQYRYNNLTSEK